MAEFDYEKCEADQFLALCKTLSGEEKRPVKVTGRSVSCGNCGDYFVVQVDEKGEPFGDGGWVHGFQLCNLPPEKSAEKYSVPKKLFIRLSDENISSLSMRGEYCFPALERDDKTVLVQHKNRFEIDLDSPEFASLKNAIEKKVAEHHGYAELQREI